MTFAQRLDSILEVFSSINDSMRRKAPKSGGSSSHHCSPHPSGRGNRPKPPNSSSAARNPPSPGAVTFVQRLGLILEVFSTINDSVERKTPKSGGFSPHHPSPHPSGREDPSQGWAGAVGFRSCHSWRRSFPSAISLEQHGKYFIP